MSEKKVVRRNVAIALGVTCVILIAGLVAAMVAISEDMGNTISSKDSEISNLENTVANQANQIAQQNISITYLQSTLNSLEQEYNIPTAVWGSGKIVPEIPAGQADYIEVTVQNTGTYPGGLLTGHSLNPSNAPCTIIDQGTGSLAPGASTTLDIPVTNNGGTTNVTVLITISIWNQAGVQQGSAIPLECILLAST
jgi:hypothetical protein